MNSLQMGTFDVTLVVTEEFHLSPLLEGSVTLNINTFHQNLKLQYCTESEMCRAIVHKSRALTISGPWANHIVYLQSP